MERSRVINLTLSVLVCVVSLYFAARGVSLDELRAALTNVRPLWIVAAVGISFLLMAFRAWRWQLELRPLEHIPFGRLWVITAVSYMAINVLPFRLGEAVRPWLLSRKSSVTISNVVGNLVIEKTLDSIVILLFMLSGLLLVDTLPDWVRQGAKFPATAAAVLVTLVLLLWWRGEEFVDRWILGYLPERFRDAVMRIVKSIIAGMSILPNRRLLLAVFLVSLGLWFLPILSSWVMLQAFDMQVPYTAAVVVFIFIGFGTALPNLPGMIGPYQYACVLALDLFGVPRAEALAYGIVLNSIQLLTIILQGLVAFPFAGIRFTEINAALKKQPETVSD